jgi:hypothetical protein
MTDLTDAVAHIRSSGPPDDPWEVGEFTRNVAWHPTDAAAIAAVLNAVAERRLVEAPTDDMQRTLRAVLSNIRKAQPAEQCDRNLLEDAAEMINGILPAPPEATP